MSRSYPKETIKGTIKQQMLFGGARELWRMVKEMVNHMDRMVSGYYIVAENEGHSISRCVQ